MKLGDVVIGVIGNSVNNDGRKFDSKMNIFKKKYLFVQGVFINNSFVVKFLFYFEEKDDDLENKFLQLIVRVREEFDCELFVIELLLDVIL